MSLEERSRTYVDELAGSVIPGTHKGSPAWEDFKSGCKKMALTSEASGWKKAGQRTLRSGGSRGEREIRCRNPSQDAN